MPEYLYGNEIVQHLLLFIGQKLHVIFVLTRLNEVFITECFRYLAKTYKVLKPYRF